MSKNYKIVTLGLLCSCLSLPVTAFPVKAQETQTLDDVILSIEAQENQQVPDTSSVVINPIEEAAPASSPRPPPTMPESMNADVPAQPATSLAAPVEPLLEEPEITAQPVNEPQPVPYSGLYFDADSVGGNSPLGYSAPRQVDPKYEPGSRFVVVERGASASSTQAQLIAAQRALKLQRYAAALDLFENLYKKTPNSRPVLMGLAVAQQNNGFTESAIATYEELLALDPNNIDATVNMLGLMKRRYPAVAFRRLKDLWESNAENPAIAAQLGLTSAATGNTRDAIRYLGIAASLEPSNASHFYNMAVLSDRAGARKDAVDLYQRALEVDVTHGGGKTVPREEIYDRLAFLRRM